MIKQSLGLFDTLNMFLRPVEAPETKSETKGGTESETKEYLNATVSKRIGNGLLHSVDASCRASPEASRCHSVGPLDRHSEGQGNDQGDKILFMSSNPIDLFIELRKLLASKKAGHSNTFNQANAIMKYLLENNYLTTSKYKKILKKYY